MQTKQRLELGAMELWVVDIREIYFYFIFVSAFSSKKKYPKNGHLQFPYFSKFIALIFLSL